MKRKLSFFLFLFLGTSLLWGEFKIVKIGKEKFDIETTSGYKCAGCNIYFIDGVPNPQTRKQKKNQWYENMDGYLLPGEHTFLVGYVGYVPARARNEGSFSLTEIIGVYKPLKITVKMEKNKEYLFSSTIDKYEEGEKNIALINYSVYLQWRPRPEERHRNQKSKRIAFWNLKKWPAAPYQYLYFKTNYPFLAPVIIDPYAAGLYHQKLSDFQYNPRDGSFSVLYQKLRKNLENIELVIRFWDENGKLISETPKEIFPVLLKNKESIQIKSKIGKIPDSTVITTINIRPLKETVM